MGLINYDLILSNEDIEISDRDMEKVIKQMSIWNIILIFYLKEMNHLML